MDNVISIAVSGMQAASVRLTSAASNIVKAGHESPLAAGGSNGPRQPLLAYDPRSPYANLAGQAAPDVPAALVDLKLAQHDFRASLLAYKASSDMFKALLEATA
jgi:flagellar basal body rod protein FlgC